MNADELYAYEWAKNQSYPSVAARYAKTLAGAIEKLTDKLTEVIKQEAEDVCTYCKNYVECKGEQCEFYYSGVGDVDEKYPDWKWTCEDFNYGTCIKMENTPCNGCIGSDFKGFALKEADNG